MMKQPNRVVLFAHGSPDPRWRAPFERLTSTLQRRLGKERVRLCYMEFVQPVLLDVVAEADAEGIRHLRLLPMFMAAGGHVANDIPAQVAAAKRQFPRVRIDVLPPIGEDSRLIAAIIDIAIEAAE